MSSDTSALWMRRVPYVVTAGLLLLIVALALPAIQKAREDAWRTQSKYNLKQLGLALANYHETFQAFPPGGTFNEEGRAFHSWTTFLDVYLAQSPLITLIDYNVPWDDPSNVDLFLGGWPYQLPWRNPSISQRKSTDGFPLSHYTANQFVMHRNSSVRIRDLTGGTGAVVLVGDANGVYDPLGYPYEWRDLTSGLAKSASGFGCPVRPITMLVMTDGSVRELSNNSDLKIVQQMAGPDELRPTTAQVAKPSQPYRLTLEKYWLFDGQSRGSKSLLKFRLSPDKALLKVDFGHYDDDETSRIGVPRWRPMFERITKNAAIAHVELRGRLRDDELVPFLKIPTLKHLTISSAKIDGTPGPILATASPEVLID